MTAFDVHQHLLPPPLVRALRARREPPRLAGTTLELREGSFPFDEQDHDPGERLAALEADGIDVAILSLAPTLETDAHPGLREAWHEGIVETAAASRGRFRALAAGACLDGFAGACVSAGALVDGLGDLPAELARRGQILFVHPGPPEPPPAGAPRWWAPVVDYTHQLQAAYFTWLDRDADSHPELDVVFAALAGGAPVQLERLEVRGGDLRAARFRRVYLDTSSYGRQGLDLCLAALGAGRLVYGSDRPVVDPRPSLGALAALGEDVLATVQRENPGRLFARLGTDDR
ncbi:MAG TPA: amidohydrolase family protein [Gaiellaceae bacterium]|nr:amidohydrolase family protein [Gaiellaceae bacterium]